MRRLSFPALALTLGLGLVLAVAAVPAADKDAPVVPPRQGKSETIQLFDGKTLDGWEGDKNLWSVDNGEIVGKSQGRSRPAPTCPPRRRSPISASSSPASWSTSETHTGVCLWGKPAPEKGDEFPKAPDKAIPYTYGGLLVMFPSGWGMWDLYGREGGLGVDAAPGKEAGKASSTTGTSWRSWPRATGFASPPTACRSSTGAIRSLIATTKPPLGCNCTPIKIRKRSASRT